jgi:hypothetical protein
MNLRTLLMLHHPLYWLLLVLLWKPGERRPAVAARPDLAGRRPRSERATQRLSFFRPA